MVRGGNRIIFFVVYLIIGLYFINYPFQFVKIPESISSIANQWIIFVGGILLIIGGINYLRASRQSPLR